MNKNLKLSYILFFVFSAVLIAWKTLTSFFGGVAINFLALMGLLFVTLLLLFNEKDLFKRIKDLFLICCAFCVLEIFVYCVFELGWGDLKTYKSFLTYQSVLSILGLIFFFYIAFRFICEIKNKKIRIIEIMLGNEKPSIKAKKQKEVDNGSLEDKPNRKVNEEVINELTIDEENIIIEDDSTDEE